MSRRRPDPRLAGVLVIGLVIRAILIPITHGQDFVVWDKASAATLRGVNVYAHHPHYPGGPYAYFPPFLYIELPFQWLAQHSGISFTVLGKLPILAADVGCALLIAAELRRRGHGEWAAAVAAGLFFLNPLVLYNSAYYGRFDTFGCVVLLLALRWIDTDAGLSRRAAVTYAIAVVSKTFPAFVFAGVVRAARGARWRVAATVVVVTVIVSVPYLGTLRAYLHDIIFYDAGKPPQGLSWQHLLLRVTDLHGAKVVSYALLIVFALSTVVLTRITELERYTAVVLVLFLLCSKVVLEQYLVWATPWLVLLIWRGATRLAAASAALLGTFTVVGLLDTESFHPLGRSSSALEVVLAVACASYVAVATAGGTWSRAPAHDVVR